MRAHFSPPPDPHHPPPPRLIAGGGGGYLLTWSIIKSRRRGRGVQYLVDWEGYGPEERSSVPARSFLDPSLITNVHRTHPDQPGETSGAVPRGGGFYHEFHSLLVFHLVLF